MAAIRSKVDKLNQCREQGTLHHHQCIDELTSHLRNSQIKADEAKIASPTRSETPTSFVTVIEVKDPSPIPIATSQTSTSISIAASDKADVKPEVSTTVTQSPDDAPQTAENCEKNDENHSSPVQTVEIRRKIPPR